MRGNIFDQIPLNIAEEIFEDIIATDSLKIERIISKGQATPEGEWLEQDVQEWVILLKGGARLSFGGGEAVELVPGDYIEISAGEKHRVEWTAPDETSIWLAIHHK